MKQDPERARLERHVAVLQRERLLTDPLLGIRGDALRRYLHALEDIIIERMPPGSGSPDRARSNAVGSERLPDRVPAWADDLLHRELKAIEYRANELEDWLASPRPVKTSGGRRCEGCGRGLQRGAKFCSGCGQERKQTP